MSRCSASDSGEKWALYPEDVLPLWVADMDFPVAKPIQRLIQRSLDLGDLGYPLHPRPTRLPSVFAQRAEERFGWSVETRNVELITDVVQGLYVALHQFTEEGEGVVIQTPIYPPFLGAVREMRRTLVENPLVLADGGYSRGSRGASRRHRRAHPDHPALQPSQPERASLPARGDRGDRGGRPGP